MRSWRVWFGIVLFAALVPARAFAELILYEHRLSGLERIYCSHFDQAEASYGPNPPGNAVQDVYLTFHGTVEFGLALCETARGSYELVLEPDVLFYARSSVGPVSLDLPNFEVGEFEVALQLAPSWEFSNSSAPTFEYLLGNGAATSLGLILYPNILPRDECTVQRSPAFNIEFAEIRYHHRTGAVSLGGSSWGAVKSLFGAPRAGG